MSDHPPAAYLIRIPELMPPLNMGQKILDDNGLPVVEIVEPLGSSPTSTVTRSMQPAPLTQLTTRRSDEARRAALDKVLAEAEEEEARELGTPAPAIPEVQNEVSPVGQQPIVVSMSFSADALSAINS